MFDLDIEAMQYGIYSCPADWVVNEKGAVFHRLYYVYSGKAFYSGMPSDFPLEVSHIYLFPVNKPYKISHNPANPFKCMYFHINTRPLILSPAKGINTLESPAIFHILKALENILINSSDFTADKSLLPQLLNCLISLFDHAADLRFSDENRLQKVLDYIHRHSGDNITNCQLADVAGFDKYYFARLFRKTFGVSPQEYISNYRLTKAATLLQKSVPISKIAEIAGYQDLKSFSRAFKKNWGSPPSEYLKSHSLQP